MSPVGRVDTYGRMNVTGPHKLIGSGTIRRCGFLGVGVALLEEVYAVGTGFEVYYISYIPVSQFCSCCRLIKM